MILYFEGGAMDISLLLAGLVLALLWVFTAKIRRHHHLPPGPRALPLIGNLPPGPRALPLIGNLPQLDKRAPFKSFLQWSASYGPVMTVYMGPQRVLVLSGYEVVKEALVDQAEDFTGRAAVPMLVRATRAYGLAVNNGEHWQQLRRFTLTTLRDFGMGRKGMEEWIQEESRHIIARIDGTKAAPFDPTFFLSCAASNVICCLIFSQRFSYEDQDFLRLLRIISEVLHFFSSPWGQLYNVFPWLMERLPGYHHTVFAKVDELRDFVMKKIKEHQETMNPGSPRDYIDCFLTRLNQEKDSPSSQFHYDNLVSTVLNLFLAGTETTSTTLRFTIMVLIKYPHIQEHMQKEIDTVIGRERRPSMEDRKSLPFTYAVIHETQRFLDLVPLNIPHYATKDISFRGYDIPKGTLIIPMLHSVLREKGHWDTPCSFNPQHFLDQNGKFKNNPSFMAFSAGKRACVGQSLARMEIFIFLVSLLQRFTFSSPGGPDSVDLTPEFSSFFNVPRRYQLIAIPQGRAGEQH